MQKNNKNEQKVNEIGLYNMLYVNQLYNIENEQKQNDTKIDTKNVGNEQ